VSELVSLKPSSNAISVTEGTIRQQGLGVLDAAIVVVSVRRLSDGLLERATKVTRT
jgi:hypothetical protein